MICIIINDIDNHFQLKFIREVHPRQARGSQWLKGRANELF